MHQFFRYHKSENEHVQYLCNPVRCVEAVLCILCFLTALYMVIALTYLHVIFKVVLAVAAAGFAAVTIVDIISTTHYDPIFWNTWILFSISAAICFTLCVGVLIATATGFKKMLVVGEVLNGLTAIVFLLDACFLLNIMKKKQIEPDSEDNSSEPKPKPKPKRKSDDNGTDADRVRPDSDRVGPDEDSRPPIIIPPTPLPPDNSSNPDGPGRTDRYTIVKIYVSPDGQPCLRDGTILVCIRDIHGHIFYRTPSGMMFTADGIPICPGRVEIAPCPSAPCGVCSPCNSQSITRVASGSVAGTSFGSPCDTCSPCYQGSSSIKDTRRRPSRDDAHDQPRDRTRERYPRDQETCPKTPCGPNAPCARRKDPDSYIESHPCPSTPCAPCAPCAQPSRPEPRPEPKSPTCECGGRCGKCGKKQLPPCPSRTVAISTRMVPKERSQSAPGVHDPARDQQRRPSRSAEDSSQSQIVYQQQQQPTTMYQQYSQKPCTCGRTHYQQATTVQDNKKTRQLSPRPKKSRTENRPTKSESPSPRAKKRAVSPDRTSPKASKKTESLERRENSVDVVPTPQSLQTISECDCETDSTTWGPKTSTDFSSSQLGTESIEDYNESLRQLPQQPAAAVPKPPVDTDEVQTSETRMIKARDLEAMKQKTNLPGSIE